MATTARAVFMEAAPSATKQRARFDALIRDYGRAVHRYLEGMLGDAPSAEDATQEVFLRAWRGMDGLRDAEHARSWLFAIAANTARSHHKRRTRHAHSALDETAPDRNDADDGLAERSDRSLYIQRTLATLPLEDRQIVLLVGLEGFTSVEAASVLGISIPAARKRWLRASARFRARLEGGAA